MNTTHICPHCQQPIQAGDRTKNAIYAYTKTHIPLSAPVHYPGCFYQLVQPSQRHHAVQRTLI